MKISPLQIQKKYAQRERSPRGNGSAHSDADRCLGAGEVAAQCREGAREEWHQFLLSCLLSCVALCAAIARPTEKVQALVRPGRVAVWLKWATSCLFPVAFTFFG